MKLFRYIICAQYGKDNEYYGYIDDNNKLHWVTTKSVTYFDSIKSIEKQVKKLNIDIKQHFKKFLEKTKKIEIIENKTMMIEIYAAKVMIIHSTPLI